MSINSYFERNIAFFEDKKRRDILSSTHYIYSQVSEQYASLKIYIWYFMILRLKYAAQFW